MSQTILGGWLDGAKGVKWGLSVATVVMAGGRGERFWPRSRNDWPKQFLALDGNQTLLQQTLRRLDGIAVDTTHWVVTREDYADPVSQQVKDMLPLRLILEPESRDTAPCIALAALYVGARDPDAVMVVLPADHLVLQEDRFRAVLRHAIAVADQSDSLVTLGIRPTRPETAYGYIQLGDEHEATGQHQSLWVKAFKEKPSSEVALQYLIDGSYLWNSGIFIWKVAAIKKALWTHLPALMQALHPVEEAIGTAKEASVLKRIYPNLPKISIDYGVMEQAPNILVIPADFGWDDLGTWSALDRLVPPDTNGNIISGLVVAVDTTSSILVSSPERNRLLATLGLSDMVVIDAGDAVLVADKSRVSDLKLLVERLQADGLDRYLRRQAGAKP